MTDDMQVCWYSAQAANRTKPVGSGFAQDGERE
jgi:hypothetical protein